MPETTKIDYDQLVISDRGWEKVNRSIQKGYRAFCKRKNLPIFSFKDQIKADIVNAVKQRKNKQQETKEVKKQIKQKKMDKFLDKVDQEFPVEYF